MYGSAKTTGTKTSQVAPTPTSAVRAPSGARSRDSEAATFSMFPWVLIVAVALYFIYALLEQHEKFKAAIQPKAIGINFRNIALIMVTVVLGLNLFKVGAIKLSAFLGQITGGRIRARWLVYLAGGA